MWRSHGPRRSKNQRARLAVWSPRIMALAMFLTFWSILDAQEAAACSTLPPLSVQEAVERPTKIGRPVTGVYESKVIAYVEAIPFRDARSITVVSRWWGQPPDSLGPSMHGVHSFFLVTSCPNWAGAPDGTFYHLVHDGDRFRQAGLTRFIAPSPNELVATDVNYLESVFGPPGVRDPAGSDQAIAYFLLWKDPVAWVAVAIIVTTVVGRAIVRRVGTRNRRHSPTVESA